MPRRFPLFVSLIILTLSVLACSEKGNKVQAQSPQAPEPTSEEIKAPPPPVRTKPDVSLDSASIRQFYGEIQAFLQADSVNPPDGQHILFTGSSSIRKWYSLSEDMAPLPVLNRGFGGAITPQVNYFADQYILTHRPKLIVLYCGENDIANDRDPAQYPFESFKVFDQLIEYYLPETHILYIAMKPSPSRWKYWDKFVEGNRLIQEHCQGDDRLEYIAIDEVMLNKSGEPNSSIFVRDRLHLNKEGYRRWTEYIKPVVERHWQELNP